MSQPAPTTSAELQDEPMTISLGEFNVQIRTKKRVRVESEFDSGTAGLISQLRNENRQLKRRIVALETQVARGVVKQDLVDFKSSAVGSVEEKSVWARLQARLSDVLDITGFTQLVRLPLFRPDSPRSRWDGPGSIRKQLEDVAGTSETYTTLLLGSTDLSLSTNIEPFFSDPAQPLLTRHMLVLLQPVAISCSLHSSLVRVLRRPLMVMQKDPVSHDNAISALTIDGISRSWEEEMSSVENRAVGILSVEGRWVAWQVSVERREVVIVDFDKMWPADTVMAIFLEPISQIDRQRRGFQAERTVVDDWSYVPIHVTEVHLSGSYALHVLLYLSTASEEDAANLSARRLSARLMYEWDNDDKIQVSSNRAVRAAIGEMVVWSAGILLDLYKSLK